MKKKTARVIKFHPSITVIKGQNDTGKSCLVRSLYHSLGAETRLEGKWLEDNVCYLLDFKVDHSRYSILRMESMFGLFDVDKKLIGTFRSVTKELTPQLADLFNYKIRLLDQNNNAIIPPPAYLYSFFYIDQDLSWNKKFNCFNRLSQLKGWKKPMTEYVTGLKPNEYFEEKIALEEFKKRKNEEEAELKIQEHVFEKFREVKGEVILTYNIEDFESEIEELLKEINSINRGVNKFKSLLTELYSELSYLENQKQIIEHTKSELSKDYEYATNVLKEDSVECPMCGIEYENNFKERFEIAKDEDSCNDLLINTTRLIGEIKDKIQRNRKLLDVEEAAEQKLRSLLESKKEKITFEDIIKNESYSTAQKIMQSNIDLSKKTINSLSNDIDCKNKVLKQITDGDHIAEIKKNYRSKMKYYLNELDVHTLTEASYKEMTCEINTSGSDLPRALLANYFSILNTIFEKSSTTRFPIIIDSPNQNAQDNNNLPKIYEFLLKHQPLNSQMILASEDLTNNIEYFGDTIELNSKYKLLLENEYQRVYEEINPLLTQCLSET